MMVFCRFSIVVALSLAPMNAWGQCTWVLWIQVTEAPKGQSSRSGPWEIMQAVQRQDTCEQIIRAKTKDQPDHLAGLNMAKLTDDDSGRSYIRYLCTPDTIDPRGPKGGGR
jgi:hypothetical protein